MAHLAATPTCTPVALTVALPPSFPPCPRCALPCPVLQRYHARRKLAVQRMEREVEEKIAQLAVLEQENRQLKWQAHILENMLLDMDKQVGAWVQQSTPWLCWCCRRGFTCLLACGLGFTVVGWCCQQMLVCLSKDLLAVATAHPLSTGVGLSAWLTCYTSCCADAAVPLPAPCPCCCCPAGRAHVL